MSTLAITGGTGSLGRAIIRQQFMMAQLGITKIRVLSRCEQKQVELLRNYSGLIQLDAYLADVSDRDRMMFALRDVHYVIHAAAQKHIDKFELDVPTGYKTNILGAQYVSEGFMNSERAVAGTFVSTDKAASPCTSYGVSKLASEHLWLWHNSYQKEIGMRVVRYGNVWGSRGSVIETWTKLAKQGKPLPITHPSCTRFFMSVDEAALFVLHSLKEKNRELLIPKMKSAQMMKVAEIIWRRYNTNELQFTITGLRDTEKTHEILKADGLSSYEAERLSEEELEELYKGWEKQRDNLVT